MFAAAVVLAVVLGECRPGHWRSCDCEPTMGPFLLNGSAIDLSSCRGFQAARRRPRRGEAPPPRPAYAPALCTPDTCAADSSCEACYYEAQGCRADCWRQPYNSLLDHAPHEVRSEGGVLAVDLHVAPCYKRLPLPVTYEGCGNDVADRGVGTVGSWAWCYNGELPGPTLVVKPGDKLEITLYNDMEDELPTGAWRMNEDGRYNVTNLHVHGLFVSPLPSSDNILIELRPGQHYTYKYDVPAWHPTGTYWYHPHRHNSATAQVAQALHGMLIVEQPDEAGVLATMPTVPFIYTSWLDFFTDVSGYTISNQLESLGVDPATAFIPSLICGNGNPAFPAQNQAQGLKQTFDCRRYTRGIPQVGIPSQIISPTLTNGMSIPAVEMVSGKWYRFRMLNTGNGETQVAWGLNGHLPSAAGCEVWAVARDGVSLAYPRNVEEFTVKQGGPGGQPVSFFNVLTSAIRYDYAVRCVASAKNAAGISLSFAKGSYDSRLETVTGVQEEFVSGFPYSTQLNLEPIGFIRVLPEATGMAKRCPDNRAPGRTGDWAGSDECALLRGQPRFDLTRASVLRPDLGWRFAPTLDSPVSGRFTVNFSSIPVPWTAEKGYEAAAPQALPRNFAKDATPPQVFNINGYSFQTSRVLHRAQQGTVEEWQVNNNDYLAYHIFHIHTWHFQVTAYKSTANNPFLPQEDLALDLSDVWLDTLGLATQQGVDAQRRTFELTGPGGAATIRLRFFDFDGELIFHCHVLAHEDLGMMALTTVGEGDAQDDATQVLKGVPNFFSYRWRGAPRCSDLADASTCANLWEKGRCGARRSRHSCARTCGACMEPNNRWLQRDKLTPFYTSPTDSLADGLPALGQVTAEGSEPDGEPYEIYLTTKKQVLLAPGTTGSGRQVLNPPPTNDPPPEELRGDARAASVLSQRFGRRTARPFIALLVAAAGAIALVVSVRRTARWVRVRMQHGSAAALASGATSSRLSNAVGEAAQATSLQARNEDASFTTELATWRVRSTLSVEEER